MRLLDEVGRRLRGTADTAHFRELVRLDAILVERFDQMIGDRVVPAARTERGRKPLVDLASEANDVYGHAVILFRDYRRRAFRVEQGIDNCVGIDRHTVVMPDRFQAAD